MERLYVETIQIAVLKTGKKLEIIRFSASLQADLLHYARENGHPSGIEADFDLLVRQAYERQLETEQLSVGWD